MPPSPPPLSPLPLTPSCLRSPPFPTISRRTSLPLTLPLAPSSLCSALAPSPSPPPPQVYPIWLCPHRLFVTPVKGIISPEPDFWSHRRQGDTPEAQMYTDIGIYYAPGPVQRREEYNGAAAVAMMEKWLIENHSFQVGSSSPGLSEVRILSGRCA